MFQDVNKIILLGNVTQDPDLRFTPNGSAVLSFSVATNRRYKQGEEWQDETTFHNIVVWGNRAQSIAQRIKKGTRIYLEGRMQTRSWDGNDGQKRYRTEVVVDGDISLLARYNEGPQSELPQAVASQPGEAAAPKQKSSTPAPEPDIEVNEAEIDPDDLPF
jgi:single-strand DNA-binding protein